MPLLSKLSLLAALPTAAAMELSTCSSTAIWLQIPMPKTKVQTFLEKQLKEQDRPAISIETPAEYEGQHLLHIELDNFFECRSLAGIPYPSFTEVAMQVPYVRWAGMPSDIVHFQPWAFVNNLFGKAAMTLLGSRSESWESHTDYKNNATWSMAAYKKGHSIAVLAAGFGELRPSAELELEDKAWKDLVSTKRQAELAYDYCLVSLKEKFSCDSIVFGFESARAAKVVSGELELVGLAASGYAPEDLKADVAELYRTMPGFKAYAVSTKMTASTGCGKDGSIVV